MRCPTIAFFTLELLEKWQWEKVVSLGSNKPSIVCLVVSYLLYGLLAVAFYEFPNNTY